MKLIKLSNGSWVDPSTITAIRPLPTETGMLGDLYRARVIIHHCGGMTEVLTANDDEHAAQMANDLAEIVNAESPSDS